MFLWRLGDKRKVVVIASPLIAEMPPAADFTVLHRLWIVRGCEQFGILKRHRLQATPDQPEIRSVVLDPKRLNGSRWVWCHYVKKFGDHPLNDSKQLRVQGQL